MVRIKVLKNSIVISGKNNLMNAKQNLTEFATA